MSYNNDTLILMRERLNVIDANLQACQANNGAGDHAGKH
jgi:hypothetical protein